MKALMNALTDLRQKAILKCRLNVLKASAICTGKMTTGANLDCGEAHQKKE